MAKIKYICCSEQNFIEFPLFIRSNKRKKWAKNRSAFKEKTVNSKPVGLYLLLMACNLSTQHTLGALSQSIPTNRKSTVCF